MTSGYYWHVHHEQLWEWCYDYDERVAYIRAEKPAGEVELRLRLMQPVRAVPERMQRAYAEWERAYAEWERAYAERERAAAEWERAAAEWERAYAQWKRAAAEWERAAAEWERAAAEGERAYAQWKRAYAECAPEMEALHALECPDCPWKNGTIFPEKK